jgi:tyrosyl-tRNA synthetase
MKNKFLLEMQDRGYLNQCTDLDGLDEICDKKSISGYIGFDCTASSLHVGSLLQIMILKLMQKAWSSTNSTFRWWYNINW